MTMLLTTHYMDEVEYLCNRIGIMDNGKLISLGTLQQLRSTHGEGLVMKQVGERWEYLFSPTWNKRATPRPANRQNRHGYAPNLEDILWN